MRWTGRRIEESGGARVDLPAILMDVVFVRSKKKKMQGDEAVAVG